MVKTQMAGNAAQVHPIHIKLERFLAHFFGVGPGLGVGRVLFHAEHADIALAAAGCFSGSILAFGAVTFWTLDHSSILPNF